MSLLTACQNVVRETGIGSAPSTIISNTDLTAIQLNALAERAAQKIMRLDWQRMIREQTITTVAGTATYALPSDWARYIGETAWDSTNYRQMRGSLDPATWRFYKNGLALTVAAHKRFRLVGNLVTIDPTPTAVASLIIEYVRNTPWVNGSTYRVTATNDADTTVFPEHLLELDLKWRFLRAKGLDHSEEKEEADRAIDLAFAQDTPAPTLDYGSRPELTPVNVPDSIV